MSSGRHLREPTGPDRMATSGVVSLALLGVVVLAAVVAIFYGGDDGGAVSTGRQQPAAAPETTTTTMGTTTTTRGPRGSGEPVVIAIAGDSYASGALADRLRSRPDDFVGPFAGVFRAADVSILNLETAITERGTPIEGKQFVFRAPPSVLAALAAGGIDAVSLANNHGLDFGRVGLQDTLAARAAAVDTIGVVGVGEDEDDAYAPWITEVRGQRIAVIGATQVLDNSVIAAWTATDTQPGLASAKREDRLVAEIERIRPEVDTIVVLLHWGIETHECPSAVQQDLAVRLEAAGADVIVGGHAHRVQGGGRLDSAVVHYGLGNFLFKENSAPGARTGVFRVTVTGQEIDGYEWIPGRVRNSVPRPLEGREAADELARWESQRDCTNLTP